MRKQKEEDRREQTFARGSDSPSKGRIKGSISTSGFHDAIHTKSIMDQGGVLQRIGLTF